MRASAARNVAPDPEEGSGLGSGSFKNGDGALVQYLVRQYRRRVGDSGWNCNRGPQRGLGRARRHAWLRFAGGGARPGSEPDFFLDALQVAQQDSGVGEALVRTRGEQAGNHRVERGWNMRVHLARQRRLRLNDVLPDLLRRIALEGRAAGQHLVEHGAEREQVRAMVDRVAARLLGGHVAQRGLADLPEAEIADLRHARGQDDDVGRLDAPVHHSFLMGVGEGGGDVVEDLDRARDRERPPVQQVAQALALDQLHRDERGAAGFARVENPDDIAVPQASGRARVLQEELGQLRAGLAE